MRFEIRLNLELISIIFITYFRLLQHNSVRAGNIPFNLISDNRTLVVLCAPSVWDTNYYDDFIDIIKFQMEFAKILHEHENVVIIADRHTIPYLNGQINLLKHSLPRDALIEDNIYDINIHDFAPLGVRRLVKFVYRNEEWADMASKQVDDSINYFLLRYRIRLDKRETDFVLSGREVVDNGVNQAIISDKVIERNSRFQPEWTTLIKIYNSFKKTLIISPPENGTKLRMDDLMAFVDENMLAISSVDEYPTYERLQAELLRKYRQDLMLIDLPSKRGPNEEGNCGLYSAILSTDKYVYVPVFGSSPSHWRYGHSSMMDRLALQTIETNTHKKVIPITVPRAICRRGLSLRSMAWTVHGHVADNLINMARIRFAK